MSNNKPKAVIEKFTKVTLIEWLRYNGWYASESDISIHIEKPGYIEWHVKNERNQMQIIQWDEDGETINSIYPLDDNDKGLEVRDDDCEYMKDHPLLLEAIEAANLRLAAKEAAIDALGKMQTTEAFEAATKAIQALEANEEKIW